MPSNLLRSQLTNLFISASSRSSFTHTHPLTRLEIFAALITKSRTQKMKLFFATLLLCSLLLSSSFLEPAMAQSGFCSNKCKSRCAKAAVQDRCMKYCGICCEQCKCVPSGTYGNKHECACYRDKRNSKGKPKCP
ncbi:hypothetical protein I3843_05G014200 [Carya illinoinensis]|uniref:Snakin-1 n=2 Tax=Carya illinoinensis TaxID=32201 RepID=A0A922EV68_CARIL|nr:snakin-1-like [Carya illinoinensis]KAG6710698.1 hypothetical protein I3842_05G015000 [Carya illinoinensis]KAG7977115.1 hypothetical protein I3843_05G014200 [Carya illinoinensis]